MKYLKLLLIIVVIAPMFSGCTLLLVGGAGAGGYVVGQDKRSVGTQSSDAWITSKIKTKFIGDSEIKAFTINVDTYEGVVTLNGHVSSQAVANRAVQIAKSTSGVKSVISKLTVIQ